MSGAPPAASMHPINKKWDTNVNKKLLMECQATIGYACYDGPSITRGGASMTEASMENIMMKHCFGDESPDADPDIVCYVDRFLLGLNKFQGLYTVSALQTSTATPGPMFGDSSMLLTMLPTIHCQHGR